MDLPEWLFGVGWHVTACTGSKGKSATRWNEWDTGNTGCTGKVALQYYGYAPFYLGLTKYVIFGEENHITINTNTTMRTNSRRYAGSVCFVG